MVPVPRPDSVAVAIVADGRNTEPVGSVCVIRNTDLVIHGVPAFVGDTARSRFTLNASVVLRVICPLSPRISDSRGTYARVRKSMLRAALPSARIQSSRCQRRNCVPPPACQYVLPPP